MGEISENRKREIGVGFEILEWEAENYGIDEMGNTNFTKNERRIAESKRRVLEEELKQKKGREREG